MDLLRPDNLQARLCEDPGSNELLIRREIVEILSCQKYNAHRLI